jgi:hypothetical protein
MGRVIGYDSAEVTPAAQAFEKSVTRTLLILFCQAPTILTTAFAIVSGHRPKINRESRFRVWLSCPSRYLT